MSVFCTISYVKNRKTACFRNKKTVFWRFLHENGLKIYDFNEFIWRFKKINLPLQPHKAMYVHSIILSKPFWRTKTYIVH